MVLQISLLLSENMLEGLMILLLDLVVMLWKQTTLLLGSLKSSLQILCHGYP